MKYCFHVYATDISQDEINCVLSRACLGKLGFLCEVTVAWCQVCLLKLVLSVPLMFWSERLHRFVQIFLITYTCSMI